MLENYYMYKVKYKEYVIMMKYGSFYETLSNDSLIMNSLFGYKLNKLSNTFKVGFPVSKIDNVIECLEKENINYVVLDKEIVYKTHEFDNNNYNKFNFDEDSIKYNSIVIDEINKYLTNNLLNSDITLKLEKIREIINE